MPRYVVEVNRTVHEYGEVEVIADSEDEAMDLVREQWSDLPITWFETTIGSEYVDCATLKDDE